MFLFLFGRRLLEASLYPVVIIARLVWDEIYQRRRAAALEPVLFRELKVVGQAISTS